MGASASRIWADICDLQSEDIRAQMIETVLSSPDYIVEARRAGNYAQLLEWLADHRRGVAPPFPWARRPTVSTSASASTPVGWSTYTTPLPSLEDRRSQSQSQALSITAATRGHDMFTDSLAVLGIGEDEALTTERLRVAFKRAALRAHPDKPGGSKEAFDELKRAFTYVEKIMDRLTAKVRQTAPVTMESAMASRAAYEHSVAAPTVLSAKKLDLGTFNTLFEQNKLPDPDRDDGYGDWLKSQEGTSDVVPDSRLAGKKFNRNTFETVFRERAAAMPKNNTELARSQNGPDAMVMTGSGTSITELGAEGGNYTAAFGAGTHFTDLKEAYTRSTVFQEVADVKISDRRVQSVEEAQRIRSAEMSRVDPGESARIRASEMGVAERERARQLRVAKTDATAESWNERFQSRLVVMDVQGRGNGNVSTDTRVARR